MPVVDDISNENFMENYSYKIPKDKLPTSVVGKFNDPVNKPSHYTGGEIECIDCIKASMPRGFFYGYLKGNILKYLWRYDRKDNPIQDLKKAQWYLNKLIETMEES